MYEDEIFNDWESETMIYVFGQYFSKDYWYNQMTQEERDRFILEQSDGEY